MKNLRPGQICTIRNKQYRAKARTLGCKGCAFNIFNCPAIKFANMVNISKIHCEVDNIIFEEIPLRSKIKTRYDDFK